MSRQHRTWNLRPDCAFILGWHERSPAIQFKESEIEYLEIYTDEPDYTVPVKIKIYLKSGAEIEIENEDECIAFGKIHKEVFEQQGGHFDYVYYGPEQ